MFLSTSPNLPMVASLDVARKQMATEGTQLLSRTIELARETRRRINRIEGLYCFGEEMLGRKGVFDLDPTKIAVTVKSFGYTGYEASEILRHRYNIQVELADLFNVVALFTIGTTREAADRLALAFEEMARDDRQVDMYAPSGILERRLKRGSYRLPKIPPMRMLPRDAFLADTEFVKFKDSKGRICAETISPYPPGIPVIAPGEEITGETNRLFAFGDESRRADSRDVRRPAQDGSRGRRVALERGGASRAKGLDRRPDKAPTNIGK